MKVKEVIDLLEARGWQYIGTKGDHHWTQTENAVRIYP